MSNRNLVTAFYTNKPESLSELNSKLQPGDLLEFSRNHIEHWAVYIGIQDYKGERKPCVIQRNLPPQSIQENLPWLKRFTMRFTKKTIKKETGGIKRTPIDRVIYDDFVRINNELDKLFEPKDPREIVGRAEFLYKIQGRLPYNLFRNNCEHFATSCRYGLHYCRQVESMGKRALKKFGKDLAAVTTSHVAVAVVVGAVGVGAGGFFWAAFGLVILMAISTLTVLHVSDYLDERKTLKTLVEVNPRTCYSTLRLRDRQN